MRHSRVINHLGRTSSHRKAMLSNMATSLILHKRITTTTAKAKALRTFVEPIITKSKEDSTHSRRVVFGYLKDKTAVAELFREISPKVAERPGGYTRILKTGNRIGDNADMCILELVDYNDAMLGGEAAKTKTTRKRRAPKKKEESVADTKVPKTAKVKAEKTEKPVENAKETDVESVPKEK
jgi:large subunit ribosomal protein L17